MLVLSSPSGCGKTTVSNMLVRDKGNNIVRSISVTTRLPREGEVNGKDYFFVNRKEFNRLCSSGEMLEHAEVFGNLYGIPRKCVEENIRNGTNTLFVIDWQGAFRLMDIMKKSVVSVFIIPPSMEELSRRLRNRSREDSAAVEMRLKGAAFEISHCYYYDYVIVNEDSEKTSRKIGNILYVEQMKTCRQVALKRFIEKNFARV